MRLQEISRGVKLDPHPVPLEPFGHQVAGQASMLMLDRGRTLCKPLIPREHHLYCTLPPSLRPFTPLYQGVLYVRLEEGDDGSLNLWGYYPDTHDERDEAVDNIKDLRESTHRQDDKKRDHSKGLSTREEAQNSNTTAVDNGKTTTGSVHKRGVGSGQTSRTPPALRIMDNDNKATTTTRPAHTSAEDSDGKADVLQSSRGPSHRDCQREVAEADVEHAEAMVDGKCEGRKGEERGAEWRGMVSGHSSEASTPMSSGSDSDLPWAVDSPSPFPSRPSSGMVVRLTEDGEYEVTTGPAAENRFLISTGADQGQALPPSTTTTLTTNASTTTLTTTSTTSTRDPNPSKEEEVSTQPLNPWGLSLHTRLLDRMRKSRPSPSGCPFLVLENVVSGLARPCILDLKVGSRLHGDDASPKKMASQSRKCNLTTSRSLGLRLCGMQVYHESTGTYKSLDKYQGRMLSDATFYEVLRDFLHNGREVRWELLGPILSRLHALIHCLSHLHSFRFYASSLLILYDGLTSDAPPVPGAGKNPGAPDSAVMKDAKGAHLSEPDGDRRGKDSACMPSSASGQGRKAERSVEEREMERSSGVDEDRGSSDAGVPTLPRSTTTGQQRSKESEGGAPHPSACDHTTSTDVLVQGGLGRGFSPDNAGVLNNCGHTTPPALYPTPGNSAVDVRMIDFAHTTHRGFHDKVSHEGPDGDYIWGLQNLTRMFTRLQKEYLSPPQPRTTQHRN